METWSAWPVHYNKWHVLCWWAQRRSSHPTLPSWGQQKEYLPHLHHNRTRVESREEKWQKSTEAIHSFTVPLWTPSLYLSRTHTHTHKHTPWPFISSHWYKAAEGTHSLLNKHYSGGKRISLSSEIWAQQSCELKQTGIVGVRCVCRGELSCEPAAQSDGASLLSWKVITRLFQIKLYRIFRLSSTMSESSLVLKVLEKQKFKDNGHGYVHTIYRLLTRVLKYSGNVMTHVNTLPL